MRRRWPWWLLALLFVGLPMLEIYLIVQLGQAVGPWWTIAVLIAAGVLGSVLVKHEGGRAWRALQEALNAGRMPARELADGALILVGGTLLLTPGFVSDFVGLFCIVPLTRPLARRVLTRVLARRLVVVTQGPQVQPSGGARGSQAPGRTGQRPGHSDVVRGEVVDEGPG
jgi:UPF0716 protein FxsA